MRNRIKIMHKVLLGQFNFIYNDNKYNVWKMNFQQIKREIIDDGFNNDYFNKSGVIDN